MKNTKFIIKYTLTFYSDDSALLQQHKFAKKMMNKVIEKSKSSIPKITNDIGPPFNIPEASPSMTFSKSSTVMPIFISY